MPPTSPPQLGPAPVPPSPLPPLPPPRFSAAAAAAAAAMAFFTPLLLGSGPGNGATFLSSVAKKPPMSWWCGISRMPGSNG